MGRFGTGGAQGDGRSRRGGDVRTVEGPAGGDAPGSRPAGVLARFAGLAVLLGLLSIYLLSLPGRSSGYSFVRDGLLFHSVLVASSLVCFGRAAVVRHRRGVFALLGFTCGSWAAGNLTRIFHDRVQDPVPYPSGADVGYLSGYVFLIAAIVALAWPELKGLPLGIFLDGVLGALSCAAAGSIATVQPALVALGGSLLTRVVTAAYPVLDLTLIAVLVGLLILKAGRLSALWAVLMGGIIAEALADTVFLRELERVWMQIAPDARTPPSRRA